MKSIKGRKELSSEIATREKLPLDLVAATALHYLGDEASRNWNPDVERGAIYRAIRFLKRCAELIETEQHKDAERVGLTEDEIVPYRKGIKIITRQERFDRAEARYKAFVKSNVQLKKPLTDSEVAAYIKKDKEIGFLARRLPLLRDLFDRSWEAGLVGRKRRRKIQKTT
jgi:hypothetical protein